MWRVLVKQGDQFVQVTTAVSFCCFNQGRTASGSLAKQD
jgi:hypothetical protein